MLLSQISALPHGKAVFWQSPRRVCAYGGGLSIEEFRRRTNRDNAVRPPPFRPYMVYQTSEPLIPQCNRSESSTVAADDWMALLQRQLNTDEATSPTSPQRKRGLCKFMGVTRVSS